MKRALYEQLASHFKEPIIIKVSTHLASTEIENLSLIENAISRQKHLFSVGGPWGIEHNSEKINFFDTYEDRLYFSAGLVPLVKEHLEDIGRTVKVQDNSFWGHLYDADQRMLYAKDITEAEREFVIRLGQSPQGQIVLAQPSETGRHIALLSRLFALHSILVIARNSKERDRLVKEITEHTDRPVTSDHRDAWNHHPRLLVTTLQTTRYAGGDDFQIIICADAESALAEAANELPLTRWQNATWYAMRDANRPLQEREEFQLQAVYGPVIYPPEGFSSPNPHVHVLFQKVSHTMEHQNVCPLTRKRNFYWWNTAWNKLIQQATIQSDVCKAQMDGRRPQESWGISRPAILVESSEHGRNMKPMRLGWQLRTIHDYTDCIPAVSGREIATMTYAATYGISADVLVRADGGPGWPLADALSNRTFQSQEHVLIVDFEDRRDKQAVRDTESRRAVYLKKGWEIVDTMEDYFRNQRSANAKQP